jgi:ABC-type Zn uptake system ZnuABC Zn-binding protein ZnuA
MHGSLDPHWWQDPRNAVRALGQIRAALSRADPAGRDQYARRTAAAAGRLRRLDRSVTRCIRRVPPAQRTLVTSHDALGYYADRYGLRLVGAVIPSLSSQAQPSARDVTRLVRQIRRERVRAIFPERSLNPKLEAAVSRESGARVGGGLWTDALGPPGSSGATYARSIASNTETLARDLTGGRVRCRVAG